MVCLDVLSKLLVVTKFYQEFLFDVHLVGFYESSQIVNVLKSHFLANESVLASAFFVQLDSKIFYEFNKIMWTFNVLTSLRLGQTEGTDETLHVVLHIL